MPERQSPPVGSAWRVSTPGGQTQTRVVVAIMRLGTVVDVEYRVAETGREGFLTLEQWSRWTKKAMRLECVPAGPAESRTQALLFELQRLRDAIGVAIQACEKGASARLIGDGLKRALVEGTTNA